MNTALVFLAPGFEEIEALTPIDVLRRAGVAVTTVSITSQLAVEGAHGVPVVADALIADTDLDGADWLVLPGGMPGASNLAACPKLVEALKAQDARGAGIAAICASPSVVLGPLGLLQGKNATCYPGMEEGMTGARVRVDAAVVEGNIVTGRGPACALPFALAIAAEIVGEEKAAQVAAAMLVEK